MVEAALAVDTLDPVNQVAQIPGSYHKDNTVFPMLAQVEGH